MAIDLSIEYTASLTSDRFLFNEMRISASFYLEGLANKKAIETIRGGDLFHYPTLNRYERAVNLCWKRMDALENPNLVQILAEGPSDEAKQIILFSIMCTNRLVHDFMTEIITNKYRHADMRLEKSDVISYVHDVQGRSEKAAGWKDKTVRRLSLEIMNFLVEAGFLYERDNPKLRYVDCCWALAEHLRKSCSEEEAMAFHIKK